MKLPAILFALFLSASAATAQTATEQPSKGANVIRIATTDSAVVAWRTMGRLLAAQGFAIKSADKDLLTLTTEPMPVGEGGQVVVQASAQQGAIVLQGTTAVPIVTKATWVMEYRGSAGNTNMRAWRKVDAAAKAYPGGRVTYTKRD